MKKSFFAFLACGTLLNTSCSKSDNNNSSPNSGNSGSLNATEQKMIGTWFLKKEHYISKSGTTVFTDTVYSVFSKKPYVKFTSEKFMYAGTSADAASKKITDATGLSFPVGVGGDVRGTSSSEEGWHYDETNSSLVLWPGGSNYSYVRVGNQLVLAKSQGNSTYTLWFEK